MSLASAAVAILTGVLMLAIPPCIGSTMSSIHHHQPPTGINNYQPSGSADLIGADSGGVELHSAFPYAWSYALAYLNTPVYLTNYPAFPWTSPIINNWSFLAAASTAPTALLNVLDTDGPAPEQVTRMTDTVRGVADEAVFRSFLMDNGIVATAQLIRYADNGNVVEEIGNIVFHQGSPFQAVRVIGTLELEAVPRAVRIEVHTNADSSNNCQDVGGVYNPWGVLDGGLVLRNRGTIQDGFLSFFNVIRSIFQLTLYGASRVIGKSIVVYNEDNLAVACGIISPAENSIPRAPAEGLLPSMAEVNNLMVVGSSGGQFRVEVIGLSENDKPLTSCPQLKNGPVVLGAVGTFIIWAMLWFVLE